MSAELLARLNPKITSYHARGGLPELTPLDIAAALAGAPPNAQRTALAAFAGFSEPLLPGLVEARLRRLARYEGWKGCDDGTDRLRRIARIAVSEYCDPPRCGACEGRAIIYAPLPRNCVACNGSGYGRVRAWQLCDAIGVSLNEWKGAWRYRYDRAYGIVSGWGTEALAHLSRRLSKEDE